MFPICDKSTLYFFLIWIMCRWNAWTLFFNCSRSFCANIVQAHMHKLWQFMKQLHQPEEALKSTGFCSANFSVFSWFIALCGWWSLYSFTTVQSITQVSVWRQQQQKKRPTKTCTFFEFELDLFFLHCCTCFSLMEKCHAYYYLSFQRKQSP